MTINVRQNRIKRSLLSLRLVTTINLGQMASSQIPHAVTDETRSIARRDIPLITIPTSLLETTL